MKPVLIDFFSTDIGVPLSEYKPQVLDNFGFLARMLIGEEKLGGEESFDIFICTPQWLLSNHKSSDILIGRHYLIVFKYSYQNILDRIKLYINEIEGQNWEEIGLKLGRLGKWEFEDYVQ